jgi:hypothetical protein
VWLGAAGQATERVPIGTGVTPPGPRYHPVLIAQAWATLENRSPAVRTWAVGGVALELRGRSSIVLAKSLTAWLS